MRRCYTCLVFLLVSWLIHAQQGSVFLPEAVFDSPPGRLYGAYLISPDSAEAKIRFLVAESEKSMRRLDFLSRLNFLLLALTLEPNAPPYTSTNYELNRQFGDALIDLQPRYSLHYFKKSIAIHNRLTNKDQSMIFQMAGAIAGIHHSFAEQDSALHWYRFAREEAFAYHSNIAQASSLNNLGVYFSLTGLRDSAMQYYRSALRMLENGDSDDILFCSIQDNIAQEREREGDYRTALRTYRFNDSIYMLFDRPVRVVANQIRLLQALRKTGKPDIRAEIEHLNDYVTRNQNRLTDPEKISFFQFAKKYFYETGAATVAYRYDSLCMATKERLDRKNKEQIDRMLRAFLQVQTIRFQRDAQVFRLETETAQQALRFTRQMTLVLVLAGLLGVGLLVLLMRRRKRELDLTHRLTVAELRTKELEANAMAQALEIQKRDITTVALYNTQVLDNRRQVVERLTDIARRKKNAEEALRAFIMELQTLEQVSDRARLVQENIERANAEFYQLLSARFPALSKAEVELCGYLRVNLSSKDIAALKNIAPASVKMSKNRLRKKLGIGPDDDLYTFIQGL